MTRDEHLAWAKSRALEYLDQGDITNALTSIMSDLRKHDELRGVGQFIAGLYLLELQKQDLNSTRRFIEGFN